MNIQSLFTDKNLLELALTHRSWLNEHTGKKQSNERLEFLGDAVLELIVSKELFTRIPDKEEGFLTSLRANLVNTENLYRVANLLNIGELLLISKGEEETGGRENHSILADTLEAIIGALFLDGGIEKAEIFIKSQILNDLDKFLSMPLKDSKSMLQEIVQSKGYTAPKYEVVEEKGPDHNKIFKIQVVINGKPEAFGEGKNKGEAAQEAAKSALEKYCN